jgi:hypothetical protein
MDRVGLAISEQLLTGRLGRRLADALFRRRARQRLGALDRAAPDRSQVRALLGLVHHARNTRFGLDHDFRRIRTPADFQRLVPLRTTAELWQQYGLPALPSLGGAAWPGPISYLATCETPTAQPAAPLPVSRELVGAHREALWTALAFAVHARPQARLLAGSLLLVGGGAALTPLRIRSADSLESLARRQLPRLLRPFTVVSPYSGDAALDALAERSAGLPVTCLVGNAGRLKRLLGCLQARTGHASFRTLWPDLTAVLYSRGPSDPDRAELSRLTGDGSEGPVLLEACVRPEGVFAVEDPRHGLLRVIADHGVYFEFVPLEELGRSRPARLGLADVAPGVSYALVMTSAAGLWACLAGLTVCFERTDPPLLRSFEAGIPELPPAAILPLRENSLPSALPPPHPQTAGMGGGPARRLARTPWSARADQR